MTLKGRERIALWIDVLFSVGTAIVSVWFAARIGSREAIRFSRYEEARKSRDMMRSLEHELNINERTIERALSDWESPEFRRLQVINPSFQRAKDSEELFLIDPQSWMAMSQAYDKGYEDAAATLRRIDGVPNYPGVVVMLWEQAELLAKARPHIERDIDKIEKRMSQLGTVEPSLSFTWPPDPAPTWTPEEDKAALLPASKDWTREGGVLYSGPLGEGPTQVKVARPSILCNPVKTAGPAVLKVEFSNWRDSGKPARIWLYFSKTCPYPVDDYYSSDRHPELIRKILSGHLPGVTVLSHPVDTQGRSRLEIKIVDPNRPLGWRWLYVCIEDDTGEMHFVSRVSACKVGQEDRNAGLIFRAPVDPGSLVLPIGYLSNVAPRKAPTAQEYYDRGVHEAAGGQFKKAIAEFSGALQIDPKLAAAWLARGQARVSTKDWDLAIEDFTKALQLKPDWVEAWLGRGQAYLLRGREKFVTEDFRSAEADFTRVIDREPGSAEAWFHRGLTRADLWNFEAAIEDFAKAAKLNPSFETRAEKRVGWMRLLQEDHDLVEAVRKKGEKYRNRAGGMVQDGMEAYERSDYAGAMKIFKEAFFLSGYGEPANQAAYNLACCLALTGDARRAVDWLELSLDRGWTDWVHLLADDDFRSLYEDPRWKSLTAAKSEELGSRVRGERRLREDREIVVDVGSNPPGDEEAEALVRDSAKAAKDGDYAKALLGYKRLFYARIAIEPPACAVRIASVYAKSKDVERAISWLEIAFNLGYTDLEKITSDADFEILREDPRFKRLGK